MKTNQLIILVLISATIFPSCVSKKKFVEMESSKLRAETRVRELTDEKEAQAKRIAEMIAEFENMKQELLSSNAQKDQMIGKLKGEINALSSNVKEKDATIEEKLYAFEYEKRQLAQDVQQSKSAEASLREKNTELALELSAANGKLAEMQIDLSRLKDDATRKDQKNSEQAEQLLQLQKETGQLKAQLQEKDQLIEQLKNNVSLLKKELGK